MWCWDINSLLSIDQVVLDLVVWFVSDNFEVVGLNPIRGTLRMEISPCYSPYSQGALSANLDRVDLCGVPVRLGRLLLGFKIFLLRVCSPQLIFSSVQFSSAQLFTILLLSHISIHFRSDQFSSAILCRREQTLSIGYTRHKNLGFMKYILLT